MREAIYEDEGPNVPLWRFVQDLIRCKDCKFYDAGYEIGCALNQKWTPSSYDYCSKAERREE